MKFLNILLITLALMAGTSIANAQKLGHINVTELVNGMSEYKAAKAKYETYKKQLENKIQGRVDIYKGSLQKLQTDIQNKTVTELDRERRVQELAKLEEEIAQLQMTSEKALVDKEGELLEPILTRVKDAIKQVGAEQGYDYIFDTSISDIVYAKDGHDVSAQVRSKLGL